MTAGPNDSTPIECHRCGHVTMSRGGRTPHYCATCGERLASAPRAVRHQFRPAAPAPGAAVAALLLGLCSFVPLVGLFCGVIAIALGRGAQRRIALSNGQLGGRGLAGAGMVLGVIGIILQACFGFTTRFGCPVPY